MSNLSGLFDDVNTQVGNIAQQVGTKPSSFEPRVFAVIEALSRNVVLPIAGVILTFIACYELIEMITQHNNMAQFEPALLMKWIFKTAISVWMISNTFDIDPDDALQHRHPAGAHSRTAAHAVLPDAGRDRSAGTIGGGYRKAETADRCRVCRAGISTGLTFAACGRRT